MDVLAAIPMRASNLMPVHIKQTLNTLGKLSGADPPPAGCTWNSTNAKLFRAWTGGKSSAHIESDVRSHLTGLEPVLSEQARGRVRRLTAQVNADMVVWNACQAVTVLKNFVFLQRSQWLGSQIPQLTPEMEKFWRKRQKRQLR